MKGSGKLLLSCLMLLSAAAVFSQKITYGNNPQAGKYVKSGDAKIYYEVYGKGEPFVLLHGGVYGYIDEFEPFISRLSEKFKVICIATRGHGKSEIGTEPFSYRQRAEDAWKVIRSITKDSVTMLGFSDGGFSALKFASLYPEAVKKLIVIGVADKPTEPSAKKFDYSVEGLMKYDSVFFSNRLKLMPEPGRWAECLSKLNKMYNDDPVSKETFEKIKCPVLVMSGDRDSYNSLESVVICARAIPGSELSIIPGCDHVVFFCNFPAVWEALKPFLQIN